MGEKSEDDVEVMMETPEKSKGAKISASVGKFEESPVFNFLNNLSPIKPIKSAPITQSINPLSFVSLPLIFASPHMASVSDSRHLQRHPSKLEFSSIEEVKDRGDEANTDSGKEMDCENLHLRMSDDEVASMLIVHPGEDDNSSGLQSKCTQIPPSNDLPAIVPYGIQRISYGSDPNMNGAYHDDWEALIDTSDLSIFHSPNPIDDPSKKALDVEDNVFPENAEDNETYPGENMEDENSPCYYRGTRRRCLQFDKNCNADSSSDILPQSQGSGNDSIEEQQLPFTYGVNESSRSSLPGIGLHLNAITSAPKIFNQDSSPFSNGRLLIGPKMSVNVRTSINAQEPERNIDENGVFTSEDAQQADEQANTSSSSPKKKRHREKAEACKRCNCKKSKCLKLYCECFAAGVYCVEPCACIDCFNKPIHEDTVLATRKQIESRNPLAFAPKVIRASDQSSEIVDVSTRTPASARHKRGCNCKKSGCLKKYCECYQGGVGCSINCRCEGCKNAFGRKDVWIGIEFEEDEADKNMDSEIPETPLGPIRQSTQQPFSSKNKPPRSSSIIPSMIGPSSSSLASANLYTKNPNFRPQPPKFDKNFEATREADEEFPDFLLEESPNRGIIKSSSPNGKRVSTPHNGGASPGVRSSRKLILQSIPSFPSLTSNQ